MYFGIFFWAAFIAYQFTREVSMARWQRLGRALRPAVPVLAAASILLASFVPAAQAVTFMQGPATATAPGYVTATATTQNLGPDTATKHIGTLTLAHPLTAAYGGTGAATAAANVIWAGPSSGGATTPSFRALVTADMPAGTGTVTSVGLSLPGIFTISGSPVTTAGTLTGGLANQSANLIWAGPASGGAAAPTFRGLAVADMPATVPASALSGALPALDATLLTNIPVANATGALPAGNGGTGGTVGAVLLTGNQTTLTGNKSTTGSWSFGSASSPSYTIHDYGTLDVEGTSRFASTESHYSTIDMLSGSLLRIQGTAAATIYDINFVVGPHNANTATWDFNDVKLGVGNSSFTPGTYFDSRAGESHKLRVATTSPVTVNATTDFIIVTKLASAGAVTVNLPASPQAGLMYFVKDGTGDAGANNVTITPAAGNIDGAATAVLNTNYASALVVYNGTQWNIISEAGSGLL